MSFSKYAVPSWIAETMPERAAELSALADSAALKAVAGPIQVLRSAVDGFADAAATGHRKTAVEFLGAARAAIAEILAEISDTPTVAAVPTSKVSATGPAGATVDLSPEARARKARSSAVWYYIRLNKDPRYADPNDFKTKNPEEYRVMWQEAAGLYDQGKIGPSGQPKAN